MNINNFVARNKANELLEKLGQASELVSDLWLADALNKSEKEQIADVLEQAETRLFSAIQSFEFNELKKLNGEKTKKTISAAKRS